MANYLVTGGFGFIGSHLVEELSKCGNNNITIVDNLSNGSTDNLKHVKDIKSYISNVEQINAISFNENLDTIFHLAAAPRSASIENPFCDIETNCKGMISVLELAKRHNAKVVFTSNSGIYGPITDNECVINEDSSNNPTTPYDVNKLASEYYCKIYHNVYGVSTVVVRLATVYGERQKVNEKLSWRPVVATFVKNILNNEEVIINGDGEQTRDLIYVKDVTQGLVKAMESSVKNADIFLLSTNTEYSVNQILHLIECMVGYKANVRYSEPLKGDIRRMRYEFSKAKSKLGFQPRFSLNDGIKRLVEYSITNKID